MEKVRTKEESTPLICAALKGQTEVAKLLIQAKADPNIKSKEGMTALHWAALFAHPEIVKLLIENGADVNAKTATKGETPLFMVSGPWTPIHELIYKAIEKGLNESIPGGFQLELVRIKANRPKCAALLRK